MRILLPLILVLSALTPNAHAADAWTDFQSYVVEAVKRAENVKQFRVVVLSKEEHASEYLKSLDAWVGTCLPAGYPCENVIYIWNTTLRERNRFSLKLTAYHEVCHISYGDNIFWDAWDERRREKAHEEVTFCMRTLLKPNVYDLLKEKAKQ